MMLMSQQLLTDRKKPCHFQYRKVYSLSRFRVAYFLFQIGTKTLRLESTVAIFGSESNTTNCVNTGGDYFPRVERLLPNAVSRDFPSSQLVHYISCSICCGLIPAEVLGDLHFRQRRQLNVGEVPDRGARISNSYVSAISRGHCRAPRLGPEASRSEFPSYNLTIPVRTRVCIPF